MNSGKERRFHVICYGYMHQTSFPGILLCFVLKSKIPLKFYCGMRKENETSKLNGIKNIVTYLS
jgi:hypothetical protein